jgi:hypothetical protein
MRNFFTSLMARLAGTNPTPGAGRADWHGRPLGERTLSRPAEGLQLGVNYQ